MKPTGVLGTGVAQTKALVGCCIQEELRWMTILQAPKRARVQAEMKRSET